MKTKTNNKKRNNLCLIIFAILGYVISFFFFIFIYLNSINLLDSNCTYIGFNNFQEIFSFPINMAIAVTTILGLLIAYNKFNQDSKHFSKQFKQQDDNIKINNYYLHMNEFIMSVEFLVHDIIDNELLRARLPYGQRDANNLNTYNKFTQQILTKYFSANIYRKWFGHYVDPTLHIKPDILEKIKELYSVQLSLNYNEYYSTPDDLVEIIPIVKELKLAPLLPIINAEITNIYVYLIFNFCKLVLEFDNEHFKEEIEVYKMFNIY